MSAHRWEQPGFGDDTDSGEDNSPQEDLIEYILHLNTSRVLSDSQTCIMMYHMYRSGVTDAKPFMLQPGASSGHYGRKLKKAKGTTSSSEDLYSIAVPSQSKHSLSRCVRNTYALACHEELAKQLDDPSARHALTEKIREGNMPPAYFAHPVVQGASDGEPVFPIAVYIDGVPYSITDSVVGIWLHNLISNTHFLILTFRKRHLCKCGCRGWCTFHALFVYVAYILKHLGLGCLPTLRHDQSEFDPKSDRGRIQVAGKQIPKCAALYLKGDWMEHVTTLAFPMWSDGLRPCTLCNGFGNSLYVAAGNSIRGLRWRRNELDDYFASCDACEIRVKLCTEADQTTIAEHLCYHKHSGGSRGRALSIDIPKFGLLAGDRLEPCPALPNIGCFESLVLPADIIFWRVSHETLTRHRNPLFGDDTGMYPSRGLIVDSLHAVNLGVLKVWARTAMWHLFASGVYAGGQQADANLANAIMTMRNSLMGWYKVYKRQNPGQLLTEITDFTDSMCGSKTDPQLKTKGAETYGISLFFVHELRKFGASAGEDTPRLLQAGECLLKVMGIWDAYDWVIPEAQRAEALAAYVKHVALMAPFDVYTPKHHIVFHLLFDSEFYGNPKLYACWHDESLNKTLKGCCRNVAQCCFDESVLLSMRDLCAPSRGAKRLLP